ncbi:WbqC family protein [Castellaniella sp. GW247-6E4]|uniref:WbqC family protein n=1 Tax=Castellaniella sp. GW247-6E4 TaxID=3140380 RepID=UPI0033155D6B
MTIVVAIHQPNFFPWLGYFDKIVRSHKFIFLDDVQFPKKGGSWSNRVKIYVSGEARWVTASIRRPPHGVALINQIEFSDDRHWRSKFLKTLESNYSHAAFYEETMSLLKPLIMANEGMLARYNMDAIRAIAEHIGIRHAHCVPSSSLGVSGTATDLLINLTKCVDGTLYLCGGGAEGYQQDSAFAAAGLDLRYQRFEHPIYSQGDKLSFTQGLSVVDPLMHIGRNGVKKLLEAQ